jgi:hypothetical protein
MGIKGFVLTAVQNGSKAQLLDTLQENHKTDHRLE